MFHVFLVITKKLLFHLGHFLFEHFATDLRNGLEDRRKNSIVISLEKRSSQKWFFFTRLVTTGRISEKEEQNSNPVRSSFK